MIQFLKGVLVLKATLEVLPDPRLGNLDLTEFRTYNRLTAPPLDGTLFINKEQDDVVHFSVFYSSVRQEIPVQTSFYLHRSILYWSFFMEPGFIEVKWSNFANHWSHAKDRSSWCLYEPLYKATVATSADSWLPDGLHHRSQQEVGGQTRMPEVSQGVPS